MKIIIPTVIIFIVLVVVINVFLSLRFSAISSDLISEKLIANSNSLGLFLDNSKANSRAAAIAMARYPRAINAFKERDREELLEIFTLAHDVYNVNYFTLTDSDGVVLARTHDPENFGDSVINQQNVIDAVNGRVSSYFEPGTVVKVSIRTGAPVYDANGDLIGVVSAGVRFDTEYTVRDLKELLNADVTIFADDIMIATTISIDNHYITGTTMNEHISEIVIGNGQEYSGEVNILGKRYISYYKPLLNAHGEVFATFSTGTPIDSLISRSNQSIRDGIILGLSGLAISIILLYFIVSAISKPITVLSHKMTNIANGDLAVDINVKNDDEIGILSRSVQKIADILHKLLAEINQMISEHEKGNIDHSLNAEQFNGGYRTLVNDILVLSTVSTTDKLTGIPNRRSFDNRLELEWNRAKRDKTPISILMMDIDRFKLYNDTFGHQQGDLALQTIAATISHLIKRSTDFAARWGGEEFAVLLPATDSGQAWKVAENIRSGVENTAIPGVDTRADNVTVSIGINSIIPTFVCSVEDFVSAADSALYKAKKMGRNCISTAETTNGG